MGYNKNIVIMAGARLTRDAEVSYAANGNPLTKFGIAMNKKYKNKSGEIVEEVGFFRCSLWGKYGESILPYLKKGATVTVFGELKQRNYVAQDGTKRESIEIGVDDVIFSNSQKKEIQGDDSEYQTDENPYEGYQ